MLKSGLNDPGKPIGVFLFAGPTGTGKTELAKTVADYLFGSVERMIRLDMSEYQTHDAAAKILGGGSLPADADTLVDAHQEAAVLRRAARRIREGASADLGPFPAGLRRGTADGRHRPHGGFPPLPHHPDDEPRRHGAPRQRHRLQPRLGRASRTSRSREPSAQTFRPEFQNRLDKVIVFKPLTRELMRGILRKELARIFERRGLKDRAWAVEWDATALEFLLEKGFSPEMGARPLKRAIDQYVIAPLAETIVERRFPEGDQFVFVRRDGNALRADFVDPDGDDDAALVTPAVTGSRAPACRQPVRHDADAVRRRQRGRSARRGAGADRPAHLVRRMGGSQSTARERDQRAGFWSRPDRFETLVRFELMDRLEVAAETATSLQARLARQSGAASKGMRELVARLAMQIHLVNEGLKDLDEKAPVEVALVVEPVFVSDDGDAEAAAGWCAEIARMYRAGRRTGT